MKAPLAFERNLGQSNENLTFVARGPNFSVGLGRNGSASLKAKNWVSPLVLRPEGGAAAPGTLAGNLLPGRSHYLKGRNPQVALQDVQHFASVRYQNLYPGIDLVYHGSEGRLEYDFIVKPGADPGRIALRLEGAGSSPESSGGALLFRSAEKELLHEAPVAFQEGPEGRTAVESKLRTLGEGRFGFEVARYDRSRDLVIDPILNFSTYLGGGSDDGALAVAVDAGGSVYVCGTTDSLNFPTQSPLQALRQGTSDAFVAKYSPSGALVYSTYLGGSGDETGWGLALGGDGSAYVTGYTTSSADFPTTMAFQSSFGGGAFDAYLAKLNPAGSALVYSTYLGGSANDAGWALAVDPGGEAHVTGETYSADFPVTLAQQGTPGGADDGFLAKFNASGSALVFSTFIGGSGGDVGSDVDLDPSGNAYVSGQTTSADLPVQSAFQGARAGPQDAMLGKYGSTGAVTFLTYLGGGGTDAAYAVAADAAGNIYAGGETDSGDFPVLGAFQAAPQGGVDGFVSKLNPTGSALVFSTYLGGSAYDAVFGLALGPGNRPWVAGHSYSANFPQVAGLQAGAGGLGEAFVAALQASGSSLSFSSYVGGAADDNGSALAINSSGIAAVCGSTSSLDFPGLNAAQGAHAGGPEDAFVLRLGPDPSPTPTVIPALSQGGHVYVANNVMTLSSFSDASSFSSFSQPMEINVVLVPPAAPGDPPPPPPAKTPVLVRIFDRRGRLIRTVMDQVVMNSFRASWNGQDDRGQPVASGVYVVVVETPAFTETKSVIVKK